MKYSEKFSRGISVSQVCRKQILLNAVLSTKRYLMHFPLYSMSANWQIYKICWHNWKQSYAMLADNPIATIKSKPIKVLFDFYCQLLSSYIPRFC